MPGDKIYASAETAVADIFEGATLLVAGFGHHGAPAGLLRAAHNLGVGQLTIVCQGAWVGDAASFDVARLVDNGQALKLISSLPFYPGLGGPVEKRWLAGELEVEVVPQGTLAERLRAGGAGLGGVFLPTGVGTRFAEGKEQRAIVEAGAVQDVIYEAPIKADFALLRASAADTLGNLIYQGTQRNWNPMMAMAAAVSIAEVDEIRQPGGIDPERVITPGIFVNRVILAGSP